MKVRGAGGGGVKEKEEEFRKARRRDGREEETSTLCFPSVLRHENVRCNGWFLQQGELTSTMWTMPR